MDKLNISSNYLAQLTKQIVAVTTGIENTELKLGFIAQINLFWIIYLGFQYEINEVLCKAHCPEFGIWKRLHTCYYNLGNYDQ